MENLSVVIPDFKSKYLEKTIISSLLLGVEEIIISNYRTEYTDSLKKKFSYKKGIRFLDFHEKKNPGDYRNEGAEKVTKDFILFLDSDIEITEKTKFFINNTILNLETDEIFWGQYENSNNLGLLQRLQTNILRYRFSKSFYEESLEKNIPYCGQSSHFIISKKLFKTIGGFNPFLRMREDNDFCIRAKLIGVKNIFKEDFEAKHLKKFSILTDYFLKPFFATKVKILEPKIFNQPSSQIGINLFFQWMILPLFLILSLFLNTNLLFKTLIVLFYFFSNILFLPRSLRNEMSFKEKVLYCFLCPIIGIFFTSGGIIGILSGLYLKIKNFLKFVTDYIKIFYKILIRNGNPIQIVNFITARCNLRCNHCFYKNTLDAPDPGEMDLEVIDNYTKKFGSILWYALGGGEPFIRKDIPKLYETVQKNCNSKIFTIPTNGWYVEKTYLSVLRMLQFSKGENVIIIQFSIDGQEKVHDEIRGPKSFSKVKESINRMKPLQEIYPNLHFSIITVVNDENRHIYPDFINELAELGTNQININLVRYLDYEHPPLPKETIDKYKQAVERYESFIKENRLKKYSFIGAKLMRLKEALQKDLIYEVAKYDRFVTPCTAGTLSYVIWEDGRVNACEILNDEIGNLNQKEIPNNFFRSEKALKLRSKIKTTKCKCTYECAMSTNTFFSWNMTKKLIKAYITNRV